MSSAPELIVTNATIHPLTDGTSSFTALAVRDGLIAQLGTTAEILALADTDTAVLDVAGATVLPGFVDVHAHLVPGGIAELYEVTFSPAIAFDELLELIAARAQQIGEDEWILGGSWPSTMGPLFDTDDALARLDAASHGRPLALSDDSHHNRLVNSRALQLAGITAETPDPAGGSIVRDPQSGAATGLLLETAGITVAAAVAEGRVLTNEQIRDAAAHAIGIFHAFGVTAVQDAAISTQAMTAFRDLDHAGELHSWIVSSMLLADPIFGSHPVGEELFDQGEAFRTTHHRPDFIKVFLDGVPPTRTAAFLEPYLPDDVHGAHHRGTPSLAPDELLGALRSAARRGLGAKVHCTGDAAVRLFLDTVQALRGEGVTEPSYQIAHGQFISPQDRPRLAELGVVADISPYLWYPGIIIDSIAEVLPPERREQIQPNRELLDEGTLVAAGSDWPVSETPNPWHGIHGLVTRADPSGVRPGTLWAEQAVTVREALEAFTINGAEAMGLGEVTGSLAPGKSADFIVVDQDPFAIDPAHLSRTRVLQTWFAGERVFSL